MKYTNKTFLSAIKEINAHHKALRNFVKEKYVDDNGNANIDIYVDNDTLFDKLSNPSSPSINKDVFEHIDNIAYYIPVDYPININIHTKEDVNKEYINEKIKEHYWLKLSDNSDDLKLNSLTSLALTLLGVIFLAIYFVITLIPSLNLVFKEIFSIIGSFCIWEAVDYGLIIRQSLKINRLNNGQIALSSINVIND